MDLTMTTTLPLLLLASVLNVAAQIVAKLGLESTPVRLSLEGFFALFTNPLIIFGLSLQVLAMLVWFNVLANSKFSVAMFSMLSLVFLISLVADALVWKQNLTFGTAAGAFFIFIGIFILHRWS